MSRFTNRSTATCLLIVMISWAAACGQGEEPDRVVHVGPVECVVDGAPRRDGACFTTPKQLYTRAIGDAARMVGETRRALPPELIPPTPDPSTANKLLPLGGAHRKVTVRTSSGSVYVVEVPAKSRRDEPAKVGDHWPPD